MRNVKLNRKTNETKISVSFNPDTATAPEISTGIAFMDHMLTSFAKHGGFSLKVEAKGDLEVDVHHTIEDIGIVLGDAIKKSIGDGAGITRFADSTIPMDESRAMVAIDISGRGYLVMDGLFTGLVTGGIPNDLFEHFFYTLVNHAGITAHIVFTGINDHHKCEAMFKAFGITLGKAMKIKPGCTEVPSTKGTL